MTQRIALFGLFGSGNLGNEASLDAMVRFLQRRFPNAELTVVCNEPAAVAARTGLRAISMTDRSAPTGRLGRPGRVGWAIAGRLRDFPRTLRMVRGQDAVIVPGMGVLEERLGARPWGLPWMLMVLGLASSVLRVPLMLVSIGADVPESRLTRALFAAVARRATYRSYRDGYSQQAVAGLGIRGDPGPIYPDLAFALHVTPGKSVPDGRPPVAVGLLAWYGAADDRHGGAGLHARYLQEVTRLVTAIADQGHPVRLVVGDAVDAPVVEAVRERVATLRPDLDGAVLAGCPATTFDELLGQLATASVVVASRYHNLIAGLLLGKPVVSLGYGPKNDELLAAFGLPEYGQQLDDLDPDRLLRQVHAAVADSDRLGPLTAAHLARFAVQLERQFDDLARTLTRR